MSRKEALIRYKHIVNKLRRKPSSFKEIESYLERQSELEDYDFTISKRTFKRDIEDILSLYSIEIKYDFSQKLYHIADECDHIQKDKLFEAFDTLYLLNMTEDLSKYVYFERIIPKGTDNLYGLLHAIKNKLQISYKYEKYWDDIIINKTLHPYALKEFKNRWYVLGKDIDDRNTKTYGLDRISDLEISNIRFKVDPDFNMRDIFRNCYGIITPHDQILDDIVLSFTPEQGKYAKSLPMHESQQILIDNEKEIRIQLRIYSTYDFKMELLSYGENVKVISPLSLAKELKERHKRASK